MLHQSSLLTPSAAAYSDVGEDVEFTSHVPDTSQIPAAFLAKRKRRTAYCWMPCNGIEYFDRRAESWRWKCARCKQLPPKSQQFEADKKLIIKN